MTLDLGWAMLSLLFIVGLGWIIGGELHNANNPRYGEDGWAFMPETKSLKSPGCPALPALEVIELGEEMVYLYESGWVAIVQPDYSFEVRRWMY